MFSQLERNIQFSSFLFGRFLTINFDYHYLLYFDACYLFDVFCSNGTLIDFVRVNK